MWKCLLNLLNLAPGLLYQCLHSPPGSLRRKRSLWPLQIWPPWVSCCQAVMLVPDFTHQANRQTNSRYSLSINKRMLVMLWRHGQILSLETATSQLWVTQSHLKVLWVTKSLKTLLAWDYLPSSFWRKTFKELVVHAGISERKSEDSSSAAAFFLMASQLPQGPPQSTALPAGSRGINFFLEHQLSWYLRVKPDYNKANKKAISTCIKKKKKKSISKIIPMCEVLLHDTKCSSQTSNS